MFVFWFGLVFGEKMLGRAKKSSRHTASGVWVKGRGAQAAPLP